MAAIKVSQLPVDPGPAAWNTLLPPAEPARPLAGNTISDWLVIGAGFAGLAAARRLSLLCPSDRIVVLDARRVAEGPAGRNSGFMIDLPHDLSSADYGGTLAADRTLTADNRHAIRFAARMAADFGLGPEVFCQSGKVNAAATDKGDAHNRDHAAHLSAMGEDHTWLDRADMAALTGTDYYRSGLFTAGTAMIQPAAFVRGVARGLASNRVQIFENSPVTTLDRTGGWTATTPGGSVTAPKVILAVNGHLNSFGYLRNRLMHVFTYASMTRPLTARENAALGGQAVWGLTPADPMGTTVRRIPGPGGDRIIVRNRFTFDPAMQVSDRRIARVARDHDRAFRARFPMLPEVDMQYRWGGRLCLSRNNVSVVRALDDGLYAACCQNGLGTARGTLSGMLAAELATGTRSERLDRALAAPDPTRLPPTVLAKPAANAFLRWQERKAGAEL
ncbi:NAD(P)/FAD-dependent oxidoreductase [Tateyamaria omphalii]|uniref:Oxidoreductase n=1 Tax=Tateyamaria omphalii TaxID=299262 RepID=A0A1P8MWC2_9RHOB|nr:FAD-binding oxidoreductase [Tateyamaria omphalii]APX12311.1 oxidoreductase [Tateyamaria omphalii]